MWKSFICLGMFRLGTLYSHWQELFYKFVSKITNKLVKQLLSMTVSSFAYFSFYCRNDEWECQMSFSECVVIFVVQGILLKYLKQKNDQKCNSWNLTIFGYRRCKQSWIYPLIFMDCIRSGRGWVVSTLASHARGPGFKPRAGHAFLFLSNFQKCNKIWLPAM